MARGNGIAWRGGALLAALAGLLLACGAPSAAPSAARSSGPPPTAPASAATAVPSPPASLGSVTYATQRPVSRVACTSPGAGGPSDSAASAPSVRSGTTTAPWGASPAGQSAR